MQVTKLQNTRGCIDRYAWIEDWGGEEIERERERRMLSTI
jgi:hypothetical protein